jgi:hypothetical protein
VAAGRVVVIIFAPCVCGPEVGCTIPGSDSRVRAPKDRDVEWLNGQMFGWGSGAACRGRWPDRDRDVVVKPRLRFRWGGRALTQRLGCRRTGASDGVMVDVDLWVGDLGDDHGDGDPGSAGVARACRCEQTSAPRVGSRPATPGRCGMVPASAVVVVMAEGRGVG